MDSGMRTIYSYGFNKGFNLNFSEGYEDRSLKEAGEYNRWNVV